MSDIPANPPPDASPAGEQAVRVPITRVRLGMAESTQALRRYVFGGPDGGTRPPRGIAPPMVSTFVVAELGSASSPDAFAKTGDLLRFYERQDVVPHLLRMLGATETTDVDLHRSAYAVQAIADLGTPPQAEEAAKYFDRVLVPHPAVDEGVFARLIQTLPALAFAGSPERLVGRLNGEVQRTSAAADAAGPAGIQHRSLRDLRDNRLRAAVSRVALKKKIVAMAPALRRHEWTRAYQAEIGLADPPFGVWAARWLRWEVREAPPADAQSVYGELAQAIDSALAKPPERAAFYIRRAAQAIEYLGGTLFKPHRELYEKAKDKSANFLWDDL